MANQTVFNTGRTPVVVDTDGRIIGAGEWGTVDTTDDAARSLLDSGGLVAVERSEDPSDEAVAAFERTEALTARHDAAAGLDKDELLELAREYDPALVEALPLGGDDKPAKDDLVRLATHFPVALPGQDEPRAEAGEDEPERPVETAADQDAIDAAAAIDAGEVEQVDIVTGTVETISLADSQTTLATTTTPDETQPKTRRGARRGATQED